MTQGASIGASGLGPAITEWEGWCASQDREP